MPWRSKHIYRLLLGTIVAVLAFFSFGGESNLYRLWRLDRKKEILRAKIVQDMALQRKLQEQIEGLESDLFFIEQIARERYNMAYEWELVFRLNPEVAGE